MIRDLVDRRPRFGIAAALFQARSCPASYLSLSLSLSLSKILKLRATLSEGENGQGRNARRAMRTPRDNAALFVPDKRPEVCLAEHPNDAFDDKAGARGKEERKKKKRERDEEKERKEKGNSVAFGNRKCFLLCESN